MKKQSKFAKGAVIGASIAISLSLSGVVTSPALAGNSEACSGAWVCVYKNSSFSVILGYRSAKFSLQNISAGNDNEVSSWENRTGTNARWYTEQSGLGNCHTMAKYSELNFMNPFTQNDQMSSWAGTAGC